MLFKRFFLSKYIYIILVSSLTSYIVFFCGFSAVLYDVLFFFIFCKITLYLSYNQSVLLYLLRFFFGVNFTLINPQRNT